MSNQQTAILAVMIILIAGVFLFTQPIAQDPAYHRFSDVRNLFGIANFWNVVSNLPFLVVGIAGLWYVRNNADRVCVAGASVIYKVFFIGIALTAFGSAYYHLVPANETLVWDRLPMTIGFAGLVAVIVAEFVSAGAAKRLLVPFLMVGLASVAYWAWTESRGIGDLRPYALVQFLPMLLIPVVLLTHQPSIGNRKYFWWMLFFYLVAKILEFYDPEVLAMGNLISGHSLKHVAAAMTPAVFLYALTQRR